MNKSIDREEYLKRKSREIKIQRIKLFIQDYKRNKLGTLGILIILTYVILGIFGPFISPVDPQRDMDLADRIVPPEWVSIFGGYYATLPPTIYFDLIKETQNKKIEMYADPLFDVSFSDHKIVISRSNKIVNKTSGKITFIKTFEYNYRAPRNFFIHLLAQKNKGSYVTLKVYVTKPSGNRILLWDSRKLNIYFNTLLEKGGLITIDTRDSYFIEWFADKYNVFPDPYIISAVTLNETGKYKFILEFEIRNIAIGSKFNLTFEKLYLKILGLRYGILGTDNYGRDIFSQLVNAIWVSLTIGVIASLLSSSVSSFLGIIAVVYGGIIDEILMRLADIIMIIPRLPLLLVLMAVLHGDIWTVIILLAVISAPSGARGIRSFVLTYINSPFVEAAKARGASTFRLITKHLFPPLLPIIYANVAYSAPAAITLEAELSYLGIATDPYRMTWGKMLSQAQTSGALSQWAWWWIMPPGLSLMLLSLAFVLIGHALDEIMNPRLKSIR